jgi:hypothetical protein
VTFWVCVIDVGSYKNLGWDLRTNDGTIGRCDRFEDLVDELGRVIPSTGLALGIEAPMFLPRRSDLRKFTSRREIDGRHPWSQGAGATVTTIGLALLVNLLDRLRLAAPDAEVSLDPATRPRPNLLHLFEAFVTAGARDPAITDPAYVHHGDAAAATQGYLSGEYGVPPPDGDRPPFNLAAAALLATGWSTDLSILNRACMVVKPRTHT